MSEVVNIGKDSILFDRDMVLNQIDQYENLVNKYYGKNGYGFKLSREEVRQKLNELREIIKILDLNKIVECLPRLKGGDLRRASTPLYTSGLTAHERTEYYYKESNIELLVFCTDSEARIFKVGLSTDRIYNKADRYIYDGNYNKIEFKTKTYLNYNDLIPGCIYLDGKDKEYLFVGVYEWASDNRKEIVTHTNAFMKLNKNTKENLKSCSNFIEYCKKFDFPLYCCSDAMSLKMTTLVDKLFDVDDMLGEVHFGNYHFKIIATPVTKKWTVQADFIINCTWDHEEETTSTDNEEIKKWIAELKTRGTVINHSDAWNCDLKDYIVLNKFEELVPITQ